MICKLLQIVVLFAQNNKKEVMKNEKTTRK